MQPSRFPPRARSSPGSPFETYLTCLDRIGYGVNGIGQVTHFVGQGAELAGQAVQVTGSVATCVGESCSAVVANPNVKSGLNTSEGWLVRGTTAVARSIASGISSLYHWMSGR